MTTHLLLFYMCGKLTAHDLSLPLIDVFGHTVFHTSCPILLLPICYLLRLDVNGGMVDTNSSYEMFHMPNGGGA